MDNATATFNVLLINANKEEHSTENYPCDIRYCYRHPFDENVFIIFFQRWIFFRANFIVCLLQFDVHHWDDRIKNAIDENMAHCYGIKRIKLDHYVGYCSPQLHIILSAMASHRPFGRNLSNWKNSPFWKDFGNTLPPREQFSAFNFESKKTNIVVVKIWMSIIGTKVQVVLKLSIYRSLFFLNSVDSLNLSD